MKKTIAILFVFVMISANLVVLAQGIAMRSGQRNSLWISSGLALT